MDAGQILPSQILPSSGTQRLSALRAGCPPCSPPPALPSLGPARQHPWCPICPLGMSRGMKTPTRGLGAGGWGGFNQAGQVGRSDTDARSQEQGKARLQTVRPFTKIFPFSPTPSLPFLFPGGFALAGTSDLLFAGCCRPPDSKAELGVPRNGGAASPSFQEHLCFGRGTWPKGFGFGKSLRPGPIGSRTPEALHRW